MSKINLFMISKFGLFLVLFLLANTLSTSALAMTNPCNPAFVSIDANGDFLVSPSGGKQGGLDTANLNCAGNAVATGNFDTVKLKIGQFYIKEIRLDCPPSKNCIFSGTTKAGTVLNIVEHSIPCTVRKNSLITPAGLSVSGTILVQSLTIKAEIPCMNGGELAALVIFTGAPAVTTASCDDSVLFGNLNRVALMGILADIDKGIVTIEAGVMVAAQGIYFDGTCRDRLLGSFTSTRTEISGTEVGALLSMQGAARVNFDFLSTSNTLVGAGIIASNAVAQFNFCEINGTSSKDLFFWGLILQRDEGAPKITKTSIYNCTFNLTGPAGPEDAFAIKVIDADPPSRMITVITNNTFNLSGPRASGVQYEDVSDCTTSSNSFNGSGRNGISILSIDVPVSGCTVTANKGFGTFGTVMEDIYFGDGTINNIAGDNAGADIVDDGDNFLNDTSPAANLFSYGHSTSTQGSRVSGLTARNSHGASFHSISEFRELLRMRATVNR